MVGLAPILVRGWRTTPRVRSCQRVCAYVSASCALDSVAECQRGVREPRPGEDRRLEEQVPDRQMNGASVGRGQEKVAPSTRRRRVTGSTPRSRGRPLAAAFAPVFANGESRRRPLDRVQSTRVSATDPSRRRIPREALGEAFARPLAAAVGIARSMALRRIEEPRSRIEGGA